MSSQDEILKAIREKCLDCCCGNRAEVKDCLVQGCPLYPFRMGTNPWRPEASEATREIRRRNAAKIRQPVKIAE